MTIKLFFERLVDNWPAKIICLTLSLLLFLFYRMSTLEQRFFSVPLVIESNGELVPASTYPRMVKIALRGETNSIAPIREDDVVAYIDLAQFSREGDYKVGVRTRLKGTALDVEPLEVTTEPMEIAMRLELRIVKQVPVTPSFKGYPEAGYEFSGYTITPQSVDIAGPRSIVEKIDDIVTETIELTGRNSSFNGFVQLVNRNPLVSLSGDGRGQYQLKIDQATLIRTFEDLPLFFQDLDNDFEIVNTVTTGSLQIKGTQMQLSAWVPDESVLSILCSNVTAPGVYILPVTVNIPEPFEVLKAAPGELQLTVRRKLD